MKRHKAKEPETDSNDETQRGGGVAPGPPVAKAIYRLQAEAGNAAVASSLGQVALQRHAAGPLPTPNPVVAALWKDSVQAPLRAAANALVDEPVDYTTAFEQAGRARAAIDSAAGALPKGDARMVKANYLLDDLALTETVLAPRANVPISTTDDQLAAKLGGLEYDAEVVGESLGGDPAPRQTVDPSVAK
jgi:hypothetical protein